MLDVFDNDPDHINEKGIKWWLDKDMTEYAQPLKVAVFFVEEPNGRRTRLLVENDKIIYENTMLEAIAARIDVMKLAYR